MPIIEVNGQEIEFPDSMSQDAIKEVLRQKFPQQQQYPTPGSQEGLGRTALEQGLQGATFGFADELTNRLGALGASAVTDENYEDLLQEAQKQSKMRMDRQYEQRPMASIVSNIGGGLLTGAAATVPKAIIGSAATGGARGALNVIPKAGAAISSRVGRGVLPQATGKLGRAANLASKGAGYGAAGAASAGLYGAGSAEPGARMQGATKGGAMGGAVGAALPFAGAALGKLNEKTIYPIAEEVRNASRQLYSRASELGADFSPKVIDNVYQEGISLMPRGEVAKSVVSLDEADQFAQSLAEQSGKKLTLDDFESIDRYLGDAAHAAFSSNPALARKYTSMQATLRESIENPKNIVGSDEGVKAQREATRLWGVSSKLSDIERIIRDADYYDVPSTAIKSGFRRIARNEKLMRGYTKSEREAIKRAAKTGKLDGIFKTMGSRLITIGGAIYGGPMGAAAGYGASEAGRTVAEGFKRGQAGTVAKELGKRSGLTKKEKRISADRMRQILKMSPRDAEKALKELE